MPLEFAPHDLEMGAQYVSGAVIDDATPFPPRHPARAALREQPLRNFRAAVAALQQQLDGRTVRVSKAQGRGSGPVGGGMGGGGDSSPFVNDERP